MTDVDRSGECAAALAAAGWSLERRVDTSAAMAAWTGLGCLSSDAALGFVANFDGLVVEYAQTVPAGTGRTDTCVLSAVEATRSVFEPVVRGYEERVGESLCPVGLAASGHLVLVMAPSGRVYGGYDKFLSRYGENGFEAVCRIVNRIKGASQLVALHSRL
jgi:hypothetical protein